MEWRQEIPEIPWIREPPIINGAEGEDRYPMLFSDLYMCMRACLCMHMHVCTCARTHTPYTHMHKPPNAFKAKTAVSKEIASFASVTQVAVTSPPAIVDLKNQPQNLVPF